MKRPSEPRQLDLAPPRRTWVVGALTLLSCVSFGIAGFVIAQHRYREDQPRAAESSRAQSDDDLGQAPGERDSTVAFSRSRYTSGVSCATYDAAKISKNLLVGIRERLAFERLEGQTLEAHINSIGDLLMGAVQALRLVDPQVFQAMAEQWAEDICTGRHKTDVDLVLFARLASIEGTIASARALDCSLDGRTKEDFVLWSLLRAWNAAGRPSVAALDTVARIATDERTKNWLVPPEERHQIELEKAKVALDTLRMRQRDIPIETPGR